MSSTSVCLLREDRLGSMTHHCEFPTEDARRDRVEDDTIVFLCSCYSRGHPSAVRCLQGDP